jgi:hypothetical protein
MAGRTHLAAGLLLLLSPLAWAHAAEPGAATAEPGDTIAQVETKLGTPRGIIRRGSVTTYYYERGLVDFVGGRVKSAFLATPEEFERQRRDRERGAEEEQRQLQAQRQRLTQEGQSEFLRLKADAELAAKPATERLACWRDFAARYPYTDVSNELVRAQTASDEESARQKQAEESQAVQGRVAAIQARFAQLDADYAASLANWKRKEIKAERAKLEAERESILHRLDALQTSAQSNTVEKAE